MSTFRLAIAGIAVAIALALAGCTPHTDPDVTRPPSASRVATPVPTPTPTGLPAGVLLRISGTAVADDGTTAQIVETVSGPSAPVGTEDAAMDAAMCSQDGYTWKTEFPSAVQWLHLDMTATLTSGSTWPTTDGNYEIALLGASAGDTVAWSGSWHNGQAYCSSGYAIVPGHATGLAPVAGDATARTSWQTGRFGFGWDFGASDEPPPHLYVTMQDCRIELSAAAQPFAANFVQAPEVPGYGRGCIYGTQSS